MEGNYLTAGELAMWEQNRNRSCGCGNTGYKHRDGMAATGIGLAAGLGGGGLLVAIAAAWGINQASKARANGNQKAIDILAQQALVERQSREGWQINHAPTISQYVDVRAGAGAGAGAGANALATAEAMAIASQINGNSGLNSAIGGCNFLRVARYSAPKPCGCDTCND